MKAPRFFEDRARCPQRAVTLRGALRITRPTLGVLGFLVSILTAPAAEPTPAPLAPADVQFFENKIRPLLATKCYKCHSREADKVRGGFLLDSREGLLEGGSTGPAIVLGKPDDSLLIRAIRYEDPDLQMPPKGEKLSDREIADLMGWDEKHVAEIRRRYVDDSAIVVALTRRLADTGTG